MSRRLRSASEQTAWASFHSPPLDHTLRSHLKDVFFMSVLLPTLTYFFIPDRLCHFWAGQCVYCHCVLLSLGGASLSHLAACVCLLYFLPELEQIRRPLAVHGAPVTGSSSLNSSRSILKSSYSCVSIAVCRKLKAIFQKCAQSTIATCRCFH